MFCSKCGKEIPDYSVYCLYCGVPVAVAVAQDSQPVAPGAQYAAPGAQYAAPGAQYAAPGAQYAAPGAQYGAPAQPTTKEGWMLLAIGDAIAAGLKDPDSVKYGAFENIEIDAYGRTYAEIVVRAKNSYGAYVPSRYAVGFFDVTDYAPCTVIPKSLFLLPGVMVAAQRKVAKKMMKFGDPR